MADEGFDRNGELIPNDSQQQSPGRSRPAASTYLLLVGGMALFGSATPVSKIVGAAFPAVLASALRMLTAAAVLLPLLVRRPAPVVATLRSLDRRDWLLLGAIAAIGTFGFTLLLLFGLRLVTGTVGAIVMATAPAVTAAGAVIFFHNSLGGWKGVGLALAVAGVLVVNVASSGGAGGGGNVWVGSLLVFGAVCCEAAYTLLGKRLTADLSPLAIAATASVLAAVLFAPIAAVQSAQFSWSGPSLADWAALLWWGAATMGLGSVLWFRGMMRVSGTTASGFMAVMPISALLLSYALLGEAFRWIHLVGMGAVLSGLAAITYADARSRASA